MELIEKATESFLKLFEAFKQSPLTFIILGLLLVLGYFVYSQNEYIAQLLPNPAEENETFQRTLDRDMQINRTLEDSKEFYGAQGLVIGQFHNGQYDLTNLPFTKVTITYYVGEVDDASAIYQTRPLSSMNKVMREMWRDKRGPSCVAYQTKNLPDITYRQRMEALGMTYVTLCPITNIREYPIGYLSSGFRYVPLEDDVDVLLDYQKTLASRIAGYLQAGEVNEKD